MKLQPLKVMFLGTLSLLSLGCKDLTSAQLVTSQCSGNTTLPGLSNSGCQNPSNPSTPHSLNPSATTTPRVGIAPRTPSTPQGPTPPLTPQLSPTPVPPQVSPSSTTAPSTPLPPGSGAPCGYKNQGRTLQISSSIQVCQPLQICRAETCPPALGSCTTGPTGPCVYKGGYAGLATVPESWATYYCTLSDGGCSGDSTTHAEVAAAKVAQVMSLPLCSSTLPSSQDCVGVSAVPPMLFGNDQNADSQGNALPYWGLGLTEASNLCYRLTAQAGSIVVPVTDRCGGYCSCSESNNQVVECSPCLNSPTMAPKCTCGGSIPVYGGCSSQDYCDWCSSSSHAHFDLDTAAFNHLCGPLGLQNGNCPILKITPVPCNLGLSHT